MTLADYLSKLAETNDLQPEEWIFHQGMLFGSRAKWWGDYGIRKTRHEGLDIGLYRNGGGVPRWIAPQALVPAVKGGRVMNISRDFLGSSLVVDQGTDPVTGYILSTVYAHIIPKPGLKQGISIDAGEILGHTAGTKDKKSGIPAHLHVSFMLLDRSIPATDLNWDLFSAPNPAGIYLINPFFLNTQLSELIPKNCKRHLAGYARRRTCSCI